MNSNRALSQEFFRTAIKQGWSGNRLLRTLREKGISYRTKTFYEDWRNWSELLGNWSKVKYWSYDKKLDPDLYAESDFYKRAKYVTVALVKYFDEATQSWTQKEVTIAHLHEFQGHLLPDLTQEYTKRDLLEAAAKVLGGYRAVDVNKMTVIPMYGFVNPNI